MFPKTDEITDRRSWIITYLWSYVEDFSLIVTIYLFVC